MKMPVDIYLNGLKNQEQKDISEELLKIFLRNSKMKMVFLLIKML